MTKLCYYKSSRLIVLRQETVTACSITSEFPKRGLHDGLLFDHGLGKKKINQALEHHYKSTFIALTQNRRATRCSKYTHSVDRRFTLIWHSLCSLQ